MRALLIAEGPTATGSLAAARALSRAGWTVGVGSSKRRGLATASNCCHHWHEILSPADSLEAFVASINRAIAEQGYEVVFAGGDAELLALSYCRDGISATIPYATHERVVQALDKLDLSAAATRAGLATPRTEAASADSIGKIDGPTIIKSRMHWLPGREKAPLRLPVGIVTSPEQAASRAAKMRAEGGEPVLQEFISGTLMGVTAITNQSCEIVGYLQQVAPRTWWPRVGMPTRASTVTVDEELARGVARLLKDLGWFGLVQLQFMQGDDGPPRLIDFNGRTYASISLATAAGINFQDIWARLATGRDVQPSAPARVGVRYGWLEGDLKRALEERRGGLLTDIVSCFTYPIGAVHAVWDWNDPRPTMSYPKAALASLRNRLGMKLTSEGRRALRER